MAEKTLTWVETKKKFPAGADSSMMQSWLSDLWKRSATDLTKFFGMDTAVPKGGKQYVMAVHQSEFSKIKKVLSGNRPPTLPKTASKKYEVYWGPVAANTMSSAKEFFFLLVDAKTENLIIKIKLIITGKQPHGTQSTTKSKKAGGAKKKPTVTISTAQQEAVTLLIVQQILNKGTKHYDTFEDMYNDPKSGLKKIHSKLNAKPLELNDWWQSFNAQFEGIPALVTKKKLKADHYEVFNLDGTGVTDKQHNFMKFISDLITKGTGGSLDEASIKMFAKKDSWNPADIWLLDTEGNPKGTYDKIKTKLELANTIAEINLIMQQAYRDKIIKGISLKKNRGTAAQLIFEEVNLFNMHMKGTLPDVEIIEIQFDPHYNESTKVFSSVTSTIILREKTSKKLYNLAFRSNQTALNNITFEFKEQGMPAQLGKIPKDRMLQAISNLKVTGVPKKFPAVSDHTDYKKAHWNKVTRQVNSFLGKIPKWDVGGKSNQYKITYAVWRKTAIVKTAEEFKKHKAAKTSENKAASWKVFNKNLEASIKKHGIIKGNSIMMQMVDFLYLFAALQNNTSKAQFTKFLSNLFYWAQKKGQEWQFGPFGKMA